MHHQNQVFTTELPSFFDWTPSDLIAVISVVNSYPQLTDIIVKKT